MPFDRQAELNELAFPTELVFDSGRAGDLPIGPTAYIAMGRWSCDQRGRP
jgi:hypothetical protein